MPIKIVIDVDYSIFMKCILYPVAHFFGKLDFDEITLNHLSNCHEMSQHPAGVKKTTGSPSINLPKFF
jgi:hypothetical protein